VVPVPEPSRAARFRGWLARRVGGSVLLPMLLAEEGREVKGYLQLYDATGDGAVRPTALRLAQESKEHAQTLSRLSGREGEPWHRTGAGRFLRNVVYGFNDGLTANFGLVAGMIGAQGSMELAGHAVVVAGLAGTMADALSMGASGYLAAKSEREVFEHEIAMEREEIRLMPDLEREELSLLYQAKGIPEVQANALATQLMSDPDRALDEKVREELRIGEASSTPMREAWVTGTATALGAIIPVAPLLVSTRGALHLVASDGERGPVRLIVLDQDALTYGDGQDLEALRESAGAPVVLLAPVMRRPPEGPWARVFHRPVSVGALVRAIEELVPLAADARRPID
jgi:VIT1/CCC1 family predicted Fe2+/Mn2+ transporter